MRVFKGNNGKKMPTPKEIEKNQKQAVARLKKIKEEAKSALTPKEKELKEFIDGRSIFIKDENNQKYQLCKLNKNEWKNLSGKFPYFDVDCRKIYKDGLILTDCKSFKLVNYDKIPHFFSDVEIEGDFDCSRNGLKTLENAPKIVKGDLKCSANKLETLYGAPEEVGGNCYFTANKLVSLEGVPFVDGNLILDSNKLKNLYFLSFVGGNVSCKGNPIETLEGLEKCIIGGKLIMKDDLSRFQGKER